MRVLLQEKQNKFWYKKIRLNITARIFFATKMFLIEAGRKKRPIESQKLGKENDENKKKRSKCAIRPIHFRLSFDFSTFISQK